MYAVVFDLDTSCLGDNYKTPSFNNAYLDIRKFMESKGFKWMQGSVYFGDENIDSVKCMLAVQELAKSYDWFAVCIKDIRMLRIEENNDLMPAIEMILK